MRFLILAMLLLTGPLGAQQAFYIFETTVSNPSPLQNFDVTVRLSQPPTSTFPNGIIGFTHTARLEGVTWVSTSLDIAYQPLASFFDVAPISNVNGNFVHAAVIADFAFSGDPADAYFPAGITDLFHHTFEAGPAGTTGVIEMEDDYGNSQGATGFDLINLTNSYFINALGQPVVTFTPALFLGVTATHDVIVSASNADFIRGDANGDSSVNLADAIAILVFLFPGSTPSVVTCLDSADVDDSGSLQITDAIVLLGVLFPPAGTTPNSIPLPNACGVDPTNGDALQCSMGPCP